MNEVTQQGLDCRDSRLKPHPRLHPQGIHGPRLPRKLWQRNCNVVVLPIERRHRILYGGVQEFAWDLLSRRAVEDPDVTQGRSVHGMVRLAAQNQNRLQQAPEGVQLDRGRLRPAAGPQQAVPGTPAGRLLRRGIDVRCIEKVFHHHRLPQHGAGQQGPHIRVSDQAPALRDAPNAEKRCVRAHKCRQRSFGWPHAVRRINDTRPGPRHDVESPRVIQQPPPPVHAVRHQHPLGKIVICH
mmetsp:Transcript_52709/g.124497  ORF Transcript_52709/g.124497 Transcript_52709/m.124497 type:complete len:240 (-) Transcript_52709:488-1207(-)